MRKATITMHVLASAATFLVGLAGIASLAEAFTISGRIVIVGGTPSSVATVWVDIFHKAKTDSLGDYAIAGLSNGEHVVKVWAPHCLAGIIGTVLVSNGDVTGVNDTIVAADIVEDGRINLYDAGELLRHYGATPDSVAWNGALDFDGSDTIDSLDTVALMSCWKDTCEVSPPSFMEVLEPDSATIWPVGEQDVQIRWKTGGLSGPVEISLLWDYDPIAVIVPSTPNDGSYTEFDVPLSLVPGTLYRILVSHIDSGASSLSEYFEVRRSIVVTEPTSATVWNRRQQNVPVAWNTGNLGGGVTIKLYKGAAFVFDFFDVETANDGAAAMNVPAGVPIGSDYRVQVYWDADHHDFSEYFTIQESSIVVTAPDTHTVWLRGQTNVAIRWESSFMTGSVSIGLYRDGGLVEMIASSTPNDGEYSEYDVPPGVALGSGYQIRVSPDGGAESASAHFEIGKPSGWNWLLPSTGGYDLNAVSFVDENTGTAVGEDGAILRTTDGGDTWIRQWGSTRKTLRGVDFLDANTGIAVGDGGVILKTTDGGATWVGKASGLRNAVLYSVAYADADTVVAVGYGWSAGSSIGAVAFWRSTDGGDTWTSSVYYGYWFPRGVSFFNAKIGAAAGDAGVTFWTNDGGATWGRGGSWGGDPEDTAKGIAMLDANTAVLIGWDYYAGFEGYTYRGVIYRTTNAGATWSMMGRSGLLTAVSFADDQTGVAVGEGGLIIRTTNGGISWSNQTGVVSTKLYGVSCASAATAIAVGANGRIVRTTDGGVTWTLQTPSTAYNLKALSFMDVSTGLAVGGSGSTGVILRTADAGHTWSSQSTAGGSLNDVAMANADTGIAVGGYATYNEFGYKLYYGGALLRTADGGISWSTEKPADTIFTGVAFAAPNAGMVFGTVYEQGCAVLRTEDNGATWTPLPAGPCFQDVWLIDANTGTGVMANGGIRRTVDGGLTWNPQTSGTTAYLRSVCFSDMNTGTVVGNRGTILRTTDGGATWTPQTSGTARTLLAVRFADANTGIVTGIDGTIIRTTDGGITWVRQDSGTTLDLYAIELFDANTAIVAGEGGAILKTTTGGE